MGLNVARYLTASFRGPVHLRPSDPIWQSGSHNPITSSCLTGSECCVWSDPANMLDWVAQSQLTKSDWDAGLGDTMLCDRFYINLLKLAGNPYKLNWAKLSWSFIDGSKGKIEKGLDRKRIPATNRHIVKALYSPKCSWSIILERKTVTTGVVMKIGATTWGGRMLIDR